MFAFLTSDVDILYSHILFPVTENFINSSRVIVCGKKHATKHIPHILYPSSETARKK